MKEQITRSYVITRELDALLKQWAGDSDRTISAELRQILEREAGRRAAGLNQQSNQQSSWSK